MNNAVKKIYLHIGLPKTGSSSIQSTLFLKKNQILLQRSDYLYPRSLGVNHSYPIVSAFFDNPYIHWVNKSRGLTFEEIREYNQKKLELLKFEMKKFKPLYLIISGEGIPDLTEQNLIRLKNYLLTLTENRVNISIIVYVRNPVDISVSEIQQRIIGSDTEDTALLEMKKRISSYFRDSIEKFNNIFGKGSIHLYKFEQAIKHPFGLVGHFLEAIGFDETAIQKFEILKNNQSISQIATDMISYINLKEPWQINVKINDKREWGDHHCLSISGKKFTISIHEKRELFQKSIPDALWLKEQFNVDYTRKPLFEKEKEDYYFNKKICREIEQAYSKTSQVIRPLIYQYFLEEIEESKMTKPSKTKFLKNLKRIDKEKNKKNCFIKKMLKYSRDYYIIKKSGLFDKDYYLNNNEHHSKIKINPIIHYLKTGALQGKDPSKDFSTAFYLQQNRDVCNSGINPLVHYILYGKEEERETQNNFTVFDFLVLSTSKSLLKSAYHYLKSHPLIFMNNKHIKIISSKDEKMIQNQILNDLLCYHKFSKSSKQIITGDLLLLEKNIKTTTNKIYDYNPQIKIIFLRKISDQTATDFEKILKETFNKILFLPITYSQENKFNEKMKEEILNRIFLYLNIEPWKTFF